MPNPAELLDRPEADQPTVTALRAIVKVAPADLDDSLKVIVLSFADDRLYEIRDWMPRGDVLPSVGDRALLIVDDGEPPRTWLVGFTPA